MNTLLARFKTGQAFTFKGVKYLALDTGRQAEIWRLPDLQFCYAWESVDSFKKNVHAMAPELFPNSKCIHCNAPLEIGAWSGQECKDCAAV